MKTICGIGNRTIKCDHKRNAGNGLVICAIDADKVMCVHAESGEEHKEKYLKTLAEVDK